MFEALQNLLPKAANRYGISAEMKAAKICHDFRELIPQIFPNIESPENYIQPAYYKDSTLVVNVHSPAFAQEVIMRKPKILEEMNRKSDQTPIKNLRTQLVQKQ